MYWLSLGVVLLSLLSVFGVSIFQGYIRWTINQNFTLLGGGELEALTVCSFGLLYLLSRHHRAR